MRYRCLALAGAMLATSMLVAAAQEQEQPVRKLSGTLAKVERSGTEATDVASAR